MRVLTTTPRVGRACSGYSQHQACTSHEREPDPRDGADPQPCQKEHTNVGNRASLVSSYLLVHGFALSARCRVGRAGEVDGWDVPIGRGYLEEREVTHSKEENHN